MKFDIYGRYFLEVIRESGRWKMYRIDQGRRMELTDLVIPSDITPDQIPLCLEDLLHEWAAPGKIIRRLA